MATLPTLLDDLYAVTKNSLRAHRAHHESIHATVGLLAATNPGLYAYKPADTIRVGNTSTALAPDPDLVLALAAGAVYDVFGLVPYDGPAAADIKFSMYGPGDASAASYWVANLEGTAATGATQAASQQRILFTSGSQSGGTLGGTPMVATIRGVIKTVSAGNMGLSWAPFAPDPGNTTLFQLAELVAVKRV